MLRVENVDLYYGDAQALADVSLNDGGFVMAEVHSASPAQQLQNLVEAVAAANVSRKRR